MHLLTIVSPGEAFKMCVSYEKQETVYAAWYKRRRICSGERDTTGETHSRFISMTFMRSHSENEY